MTPAADSAATMQTDGATAATMQTIADRLNLSVATVSRALRRVPGINAETRARVFEMATQLGYRLPKSYQTTTVEDKDLTHVGVLVATPTFGLPALYMTGLSDASMTLNASLMIHYERPENCERILDPKFQPRAMNAGLLSGLVLIFRWPDAVVEELSKLMPTVCIVHRYPEVDVDMVGIDNQQGIELLMRHLYRMGHRRIGFFGRSGEMHWSSVRFGAYVGALTSLGIPYRSEWTIEIDAETLIHQGARWDKYTVDVERLVREEGVSAWISVAEPAARRLYICLTARGLRVPEDVSITGFHRPDTAPPEEVPLTSVTASYEAIGAAALKRLFYRIQNPADSTRTILFPCELYHGATVAPPSPDLAAKR